MKPRSAPPAPCGTPRWRGSAVLLALALLVAPAGAAPDPTGPATAADCQSLLHQFDVAWPAHKDAARAANARRNRDQGAADCSQSHYADGVRHLRRALHDIGVKPVKIVSVAPAH